MTDDTIRECVDCGDSIHRSHDQEWGCEPDDTLCWGCQQEEIERLRVTPQAADHCVWTGGTIRCTICGDEVPMPLGDIPWLCGVLAAFMASHTSEPHTGKRTYFQERVT